MAKCLVLGANGFIGSHLVDALIKGGHSVRAFDRFGGNPRNFLPSSSIEEFNGDFLNRDDLANALKGMDYVFHLISTTTPASAENDPLIDIETNIKMSVVLFEECVSHKIKKVIFPSTGGAIYGGESAKPIAETTTPEPVSPYAIGKLTIEHYLRYFETKFGLKSLVLRISNPYGERQSPAAKQGVIPIFLQQIANDQPITVLGDGSMVRDYIYVKDVAQMIATSFAKTKHRLYNLGSGQGVTVSGLVDIMRKVTKRDISVQHREVPPTFVRKIVLDVSRFQSEFKPSPQVTLEEGIRRTWGYVSGVKPSHEN